MTLNKHTLYYIVAVQVYQWAEQDRGALNHSRIPLAEKVQNETAREIWDALDVRLD